MRCVAGCKKDVPLSTTSSFGLTSFAIVGMKGVFLSSKRRRERTYFIRFAHSNSLFKSDRGSMSSSHFGGLS